MQYLTRDAVTVYQDSNARNNVQRFTIADLTTIKKLVIETKMDKVQSLIMRENETEDREKMLEIAVILIFGVQCQE